RPSIASQFVIAACMLPVNQLSRETTMLETAPKPAVTGDGVAPGQATTGQWRRPVVLLAVTALAGTLAFGAFVQADTGPVSAPTPPAPTGVAHLPGKASPVA